MKPRRTRKPTTVLRELEAKVELIHGLAGWSDTRGYYDQYRDLLAELRRALPRSLKSEAAK